MSSAPNRRGFIQSLLSVPLGNLAMPRLTDSETAKALAPAAVNTHVAALTKPHVGLYGAGVGGSIPVYAAVGRAAHLSAMFGSELRATMATTCGCPKDSLDRFEDTIRRYFGGPVQGDWAAWAFASSHMLTAACNVSHSRPEGAHAMRRTRLRSTPVWRESGYVSYAEAAHRALLGFGVDSSLVNLWMPTRTWLGMTPPRDADGVWNPVRIRFDWRSDISGGWRGSFANRLDCLGAPRSEHADNLKDLMWAPHNHPAETGSPLPVVELFLIKPTPHLNADHPCFHVRLVLSPSGELVFANTITRSLSTYLQYASVQASVLRQVMGVAA